MSLATARYGKDLVRVFRVVRNDTGVHEVAEYEVRAMLEGEIATRSVACCVLRPSVVLVGAGSS
jgi:hypothetical protein